MPNSIDRSIQAAEVSLRMEGYTVSGFCKELCRKMLAGEITMEEYLRRVTAPAKAGLDDPSMDHLSF